MNPQTERDDGASKAPSREEIETLCVLHAIGLHGCPSGDLATRLGLSPALATAVAVGIEPLIGRALIVVREGLFVVTDEGHRWTRSRLSGLGVG